MSCGGNWLLGEFLILNCTRKCYNPPSQMSFHWKAVWSSKVPPKISFFVWMAVLGRILTNGSLRKCWLVIIDWCCVCKRAGESTNHLLLYCLIDSEMWNIVFTLFGLSWVMPKDVSELLASWSGKFMKHRNGEIWNMVPHCMIWGIWKCAGLCRC